MKSKKQLTKRMITALLSFSLAFGPADPGLLLYAAEETGLSENEVSCNETVPDNAGASENEAPLSEDGVSANEEIPVEAEAQDPFASGELLGWGVPVEEDGSGEPSTINTERRSSDQETVKQLILAKKSEYPEGMKWTNENYYAWKGGIWSGGYGCAGFAFLLSDVAFDDAKARQIFTVKFSSVRVGDILRVNNDTHSVIITEVRSDGVVLAEGNYNSSIHWGREMSAAEVEKADYIVTRYADDPGSGDPNKLCVKIAPSGQYHNWDGVTNVAQFKGADGNLCLAADSGTVVKIYKADAEGKTTFLVNLKKQHNKFGTALCDDSGNYYLVTGEDNDTEDTGVKTVFISKYDSKGNHIKTVGDNGGGHGDDGHCTKIPFYAGNCDAAIKGNILTAIYARTMYSGHQSCSVFSVNTDSMEKYDTGAFYESHSFAQRVVPTGKGFVYMSEGDCFDRQFKVYSISLSGGGSAKEQGVFDFWVRDGAYDDYNMVDVNENFAHMGGLAALSDGRIAFAAQSARSLSEAAKNESEDIFIQIFDPEGELDKASAYTTSGERSGLAGNNGRTQVVNHGVKWLSLGDNVQTATDVQIVSTSNDDIVILFQGYAKDDSYMGVYYIILDKNGNVINPATLYKADALLNSCEMPVYANGTVTWAGNKNGDSTNRVFAYSLDTSVTAAPVFDPAGGYYTKAQTVSITCPTEGAVIYYTTDKKNPDTKSLKYTGPITVNKDTTLKAFAVREGMRDSTVARAVYTIDLPSVPHEVKVAGGSGSGSYAAGNHVIIKADKAPDGQVFSGWKSTDGVSFDDPLKESTWFIMPRKDVTVTAAYRKKKTADGLWIEGLEESYTYTGAAIKPSVTVRDGEHILRKGKDYAVTYKNNINAGENALLIVSFKGNYKGTAQKKVKFRIDPAVLGEDVIVFDNAAAVTGKPQRPIPILIMAKTGNVIGGKPFRLEYFNNKNVSLAQLKAAGTYSIKVTPVQENGNFSGEAQADITLVSDSKFMLAGAAAALKQKNYVWTGEEVVPESGTYSLLMKGKALEEKKDYVLRGIYHNAEPGKARMVFAAIDGNSAKAVGCKTVVFNITKGRRLNMTGDEGAAFEFAVEKSVPYLKGGAKPEVTVKDNGSELVRDRDYTLKYGGDRQAGGTAFVTVTGKGRYKGSKRLEFEVTQRSLEDLASGCIISDAVISGQGKGNPKVIIRDLDGKKLKETLDYSITQISDEPDADGYHTVKIEGAGSYKGSIDGRFRYIESSALIGRVKAVKLPNRIYTGEPVTLTDEDLKNVLYTGSESDPQYLVLGTDFETAAYGNNVNAGTAWVTLKGIGAYGGIRTLQFRIVPKKGE